MYIYTYIYIRIYIAGFWKRQRPQMPLVTAWGLVQPIRRVCGVGLTSGSLGRGEFVSRQLSWPFPWVVRCVSLLGKGRGPTYGLRFGLTLNPGI